MKPIRRVVAWLGPTRAQIIFILLASTGLISLILNAVYSSGSAKLAWIPLAQSLLAIGFLVGTAITVLTRFSSDERRQASLAVVPALAGLSLGLLYPKLLLFFGPVSIGWLLIAMILMRGRVRREYQVAIKHLRKGEYEDAIKVMSELIKEEPDNADHRRFRAELFRLSGKIKRSRVDYEKVIELTPDSAVGYNGMSEVYLQDGEFEQALSYAKRALEIEPDHWVTPYNLGMIEDRLSLSEDAAQHLEQALRVGVPDSRHRLLIYLWMARAYYRQGKPKEAEAQIEKMKRERDGLNEWNTIFENDEAAVLREALEADVNLAQRMYDGEPLDVLAEKSVKALGKPAEKSSGVSQR